MTESISYIRESTTGRLISEKGKKERHTFWYSEKATTSLMHTSLKADLWAFSRSFNCQLNWSRQYMAIVAEETSITRT
jgi:hypothetical protein